MIQTSLPSYRLALIDVIRNHLGARLEVFCGGRFFDPSIKRDEKFKPDIFLKNRFFLNNKILWQSGLLKHVLRDDIMVLTINPRVLSNWVALIIRKAVRKKTFLWGHAWSKGGKNTTSEVLRHAMRSLGNEIIVYTNTQKRELKLKMGKKNIHVAPNAIYHKSEMTSAHDHNPRDIIFVSRMATNKKPLLLIKAFEKSISHIPRDSRLLLIGDGPEVSNLKTYIANSNLNDRVILLGEITNVEKLAQYYFSSLVSVSPGRVGLGLTQSLGFGVPMIIAKNEKHGPEIEAANEGYNSYYFNENDSNDLSQKINKVFQICDDILLRRNAICENCKEQYSVEAMAQTFINLV
ncbi:hypothetical protein BST86_12090 [Nonlabens agnitus]|uniref:Glycosyl transferase family 1 domain-containing protein n=1 Tax=Nonlabens agnitus TaxID=870484 RepID=A0A2S9WY46_9FLAO|nr:hypothetical protein BST86_12090 [Nonlabens agnitus]